MFSPIDDIIPFDRQRQYQEDISLKTADLATSLSYRNTTDHGDSFVSIPSPATINRRVKQYGSKLKLLLPERLTGTEADAFVADGTKCHS